MKETQDNHWIDKIKELLENYTPADPPGEWKQVHLELKRALPWPARWLLWLRKPWIYGIIFGAALITGAICLYPDLVPGAKDGYQVSGIGGRGEEEERIKSKDQRKSKEEKERKEEQEVSALKQYYVGNNSFYLYRPLKACTSDGYVLCPTPGLKTGAISKGSDSRGPISQNLILSPDTELTSGPNRQPATGNRQPILSGNRQPATKHRLDLRSIRLPGAPWKVSLGYEYLSLIQPDTGRGSYRGFNVRFNREVSERVWVGTGLILGRIDLIDVSKNWVRDWSKTDSLGTIYLRDSTTSEHRWQEHAAIPLTITWDLLRNRNFAIPLSAGSTLGWVYSRRHFDVYEDSGRGGGGSPSEFTYFISADLSLGYEVFYRYGLSATLSAEYHRILTGRRSYGFGQNFIGARILINLDFSEKKWR